MVFLVEFEADVQGLASVKRINGVMYVFAKDASTARHFMEGYLTNAYSESFAIIRVEQFPVLNLES